MGDVNFEFGGVVPRFSILAKPQNAALIIAPSKDSLCSAQSVEDSGAGLEPFVADKLDDALGVVKLEFQAGGAGDATLHLHLHFEVSLILSF